MAKRTTKQKRNNLITGNTGMYFVAYQLSRRGWNVMPTSRNARGIDLLAYDANARNFLGLQIKTLSRGRNAVPLGLHPQFLGDWWIVVTNVGNIAEVENPECFVLTPGEVKRGAVQDEGAPQACWLPWDYYSKERFKDWDRIGRGDAAVRR
jgi:hypothetical protein